MLAVLAHTVAMAIHGYTCRPHSWAGSLGDKAIELTALFPVIGDNAQTCSGRLVGAHCSYYTNTTNMSSHVACLGLVTRHVFRQAGWRSLQLLH